MKVKPTIYIIIFIGFAIAAIKSAIIVDMNKYKYKNILITFLHFIYIFCYLYCYKICSRLYNDI